MALLTLMILFNVFYHRLTLPEALLVASIILVINQQVQLFAHLNY